MPDIWFGTRGPRDARIAVVGEAWGQQEAAEHRPFVGPAGRELHAMFAEAGIDLDQCFLTNLYAGRPKPSDDFTNLLEPAASTVAGLAPKPELLAGINALYEQLDAVNPDVVIACGNYPLWALTNVATTTKPVLKPRAGKAPTPSEATGIGKYRGSQLFRLRHRVGPVEITNTPVLPIWHPSAVLRNWSWRREVVHDLRTRVPLALEGQWQQRLYKFHTQWPAEAIVTWLRQQSALATLTGRLEVSLDIENVRETITCMGLGTSVDEALSIPFVDLVGDGTFRSYWSMEDEKSILRALAAFLHNPNVWIIGQNLIYDMQWLWHTMRIRPQIAWDTLIAQHRMWPGTQKGLGYLSSFWCARHVYWKDDNKDWDEADQNIGLTTHLAYNCEDIVRTYEVCQVQRDVMAQLGIGQDSWQFELDKLNLALEMNQHGMYRNPKELGQQAAKLIEQMMQISTKLELIAPKSIFHQQAKKGAKPWYNSDAQIKYLLYDVLGLKVQLDKKTKRPSSSKESLTTLIELYPRLTKLFRLLMDYGSLSVLHSTFIQAKVEPDGQFRAQFNPAGTDTFRWSSSKNAFRRGGNMQNIPAGGDEDDTTNTIVKPNMRRMFEVRPDEIIIDADITGADAFVVAWDANDAGMKEALRKGIKLHADTATKFWGTKFTNAPGETSNKRTPKGKMYDDIKRATHGTNYGASARTIALALGWSQSDAARFKEFWLHELHPGIGEWHERTEHMLRTTGCAENQFGYRIRYFDRVDGLLPEALAWRPQSTVAIASFIGAVRVAKRFGRDSSMPIVRFLLQVHDSIVMALKTTEVSAIPEIAQLLKVTIPYPDPLVMSSKIAAAPRAWGDVVELKNGVLPWI